MILIVTIEDSHNVYCPRIDPDDIFDLSGMYALSPRVYSIYTQSDDFGTTRIEKREGICYLSLFNAVLVPITSEEILLRGGEWDGEILQVQEDGNLLIFQDMIFARIECS